MGEVERRGEDGEMMNMFNAYGTPTNPAHSPYELRKLIMPKERGPSRRPMDWVSLSEPIPERETTLS